MFTSITGEYHMISGDASNTSLKTVPQKDMNVIDLGADQSGKQVDLDVQLPAHHTGDVYCI